MAWYIAPWVHFLADAISSWASLLSQSDRFLWWTSTDWTGFWVLVSLLWFLATLWLFLLTTKSVKLNREQNRQLQEDMKRRRREDLLKESVNPSEVRATHKKTGIEGNIQIKKRAYWQMQFYFPDPEDRIPENERLMNKDLKLDIVNSITNIYDLHI